MGDYILEDGLFMQAARHLLKSEFSIHWYDVYPPYSASFGQAVTHTYLLNIDKELKRPPALFVERGMRPLYAIQPNHAMVSHPPMISGTNTENALNPDFRQPENLVDHDWLTSLDPAAPHRLLNECQPHAMPPENRSNRVKYQCPCCLNAVWGKPKLNIICGDCDVKFQAA